MGLGSLTGAHYIRLPTLYASYTYRGPSSRAETLSGKRGGREERGTRKARHRGGPRAVEAAGFEPASASALSVRFYERSSRFIFACLAEPGRRREASPLSVPRVPRARTREVSPLNDTGTRIVNYPDRWAAFS